MNERTIELRNLLEQMEARFEAFDDKKSGWESIDPAYGLLELSRHLETAKRLFTNYRISEKEEILPELKKELVDIANFAFMVNLSTSRQK